MDLNLTTIKRIPEIEVLCRFCLTQEALTSITADDLLQIMICPTINQYDDEDMPAYICNGCRLLVQHSHNFHRMCKKASKLLAQYQFTGKLPMPLDRPQYVTTLSTCEASINTEPLESSKINGTNSIATQTYEDDFEGEELTFVNEATISKTEVDDEVNAETNEPMLTETCFLYESCNTDETFLEDSYNDDDEEVDDTNDELVNENLNNNFNCDFCELTFPLRQLRDIHLNEHNRIRKFECDKCSKKFYTKKDLNQHETVHTGKKPFKCMLCGKGYTRKSSLDRHESKHAEVPKYVCIYCDKSFPSRLTLEEHMKNHDSAQKFTCNVCYKSFGFRKNLIRHSAIHQQIYPCEYCDEGFGTQKKLTAHLLTHSVVDSPIVYYCEKCEESFSNSKQFNQHMHIHSAESEKTLNCFYCNSNFRNREEFVMHTAIHSRENQICTLCMMQFQDVHDIDAEINEHIKLHIKGDVFICEFCNFMCLTETELSLHTC